MLREIREQSACRYEIVQAKRRLLAEKGAQPAQTAPGE
jgi:hypothetical protein